MKNSTKLLIIICSLLLITIAGCKKSSDKVEPQTPDPIVTDFTVDSLNYSVNNDGSTVTVTGHVEGYYAMIYDLRIPDTVSYLGKNYSVTAIGNKAFYDCAVFNTNLSLPSTVTQIGDSAFYFCDFTGDLNLPSRLTYIGDAAFAYCQGLTGSLYIPDSVTYLGERAFMGCMSLNGTLHISRNITAIKTGTFDWCQSLMGTLYIPKSVTEIGDYAFQGCAKFTGILEIPQSVVSIGESAFAYCIRFNEYSSLAPEPPTIGDFAFQGNAVKTLTVPCGSVPQYENSSWNQYFDTFIEDCDKN